MWIVLQFSSEHSVMIEGEWLMLQCVFAALNKGAWRWWREQKVDARTIKRIQELQPPAADVFLSDVKLATKSSTELSFMLLDIAKALGCNKAMSLAFKFVTVGHTLDSNSRSHTRQ